MSQKNKGRCLIVSVTLVTIIATLKYPAMIGVHPLPICIIALACGVIAWLDCGGGDQ